MAVLTTALSLLASVLSTVPGRPGITFPPTVQEPKYLDAPSRAYVLEVKSPDSFKLDQYESYDSRTEDSISWDWSIFGGDSFAVSATRYIEQVREESPVDFDYFQIPVLRDSLVTIDVYSEHALSMYIGSNNDPKLKDSGFLEEVGSAEFHVGNNTFSIELNAGFYEIGFYSIKSIETGEFDTLFSKYEVEITVQPRVYKNSLDIKLLANRYDVKAAYWVNDAKPYGVSNISEGTGFQLHSYSNRYWNGLPLAAYEANDSKPVLLSRLYVWDYETKLNIRNSILRIRDEALVTLKAEEEYEIRRNNVNTFVDGVLSVAEIMLSFVPVGGLLASLALELGEELVEDLSFALVDCFIPPLVTNTRDFIAYLSTLAAAFETTDPDAFETVMISTYYTATAEEVDLSCTFTYHLERPDNLYYSDFMLDCPSDSVGGGKFGYVTESFDGPFVASELAVQDVSESLSYDRGINLNEELYLNSFDDYEYAGFMFTAPSDGAYSIQNSVDVGLKISVSSLWKTGLANSLDSPFERVSAVKPAGHGEYVDFYLNEGESVQIFVEGENGSPTSGATNLLLSNDVSHHNEHHYRSSCKAIDSTVHGFYCWCGEYKTFPHNFGGAIPGTSAWQKAVCKVCGYSNAWIGG